MFTLPDPLLFVIPGKFFTGYADTLSDANTEDTSTGYIPVVPSQLITIRVAIDGSYSFLSRQTWFVCGIESVVEC